MRGYLRRVWNRYRNQRRYINNIQLIESELNRIDRQIELQREALKRSKQEIIDLVAVAESQLDKLVADLNQSKGWTEELRQTLKVYETELESLRSLKNINEDVQIPALMLVIERMQSIYRTDVDTQIKRQMTTTQG